MIPVEPLGSGSSRLMLSESLTPVCQLSAQGQDGAGLAGCCCSSFPPGPCLHFPRFEFYKNISKSHDAAAAGKSHHLIKLPLLRYRDRAKVPSSKSPSFPREEVAISAPGTLGEIQHWSESGDDNQFKETENQRVFCSPGDTNI